MIFFKKRAEERNNEKEASIQLINNELDQLKKLGYQNLKKKIDSVETKELKFENDVYQIEINFMYDDPTEMRTIRVMGMINKKNKLLSSISPITECFLIEPDGSID